MKVFLLISVLVISQIGLALSAPWYDYHSQMRATLGADPCVVLSELEEKEEAFQTQITVCDQSKAESLAHFILWNKSYGAKLSVLVTLRGPKGEITVPSQTPIEPRELAKLLTAAFKGNPYFSEAVVTKWQDSVWFEFKKAVVQHWADNISDRYSNISQVSSHAFEGVLDMKRMPKVMLTVARE